MSFIDIITRKVEEVFAIKEEYAVGSHFFYEPIDVNLSNFGEIACIISQKLSIKNWFLTAYYNYFVFEIDDKYIIVYIANDRIDDTIEVVIRRCNNDQEFADMMLMIT